MTVGHRTISRILPRLSLERLVTGKQVVLLEGPGGFGKTTFGEQLLISAELAAVRVRLAHPTDGAGLLDAIVRGCRRSGLNDLGNAVETSRNDAVDRLLGAMAQRLDPVIVMIDDAQLLTVDGQETLADVAGDLPPRCRLVIAGRRLPHNRYGRAGNTVRLDATALRFDADDIAVLLGTAVTDPLIVDVIRVTDRWPAAVALAAANFESDPGWSPDAASDGRRTVVALVDQLLSGLSPQRRRSLQILSRLPLLDDAVVEHVEGLGPSTELLEIGLPLQKVGRWSVIPDAIREALRTHGGDAKGIVRWAAFYYAESGEFAAATSLLVSEGDLATLAELLADCHWSDLESLGFGTVRALTELIGDHLGDHPQALLNAVWVADRRDPALKMAWISAGLQTVPDSPARRGLEAEAAIETARRGDMDTAEQRANELLQRTPVAERVTRARAFIAKGMAHSFRSTPSELRRAEAAFEDACGNLRVSGEVRWEAYALERCSYLVAFKRGAFTRAAEQLEASIVLCRTESRDRLTALTSYAEVLCILGRTGEARAAAFEAMTVGRRWGDPLVIGFAAWTLAWIAAYQEDATATREALQVVEDNPAAWFDQLSGHEFLVDAALMMSMIGDDEECRRYAARAADHEQASADLLALLTARIEVLVGDPASAVQLMRALECTAYADPGQAWQRMLWSAVAELRGGDNERARDLVQRSLRATEQLGLPDLPERLEGRVVRMLSPVWPRHEERAAKSLTRLTLLGGFNLRRGAEDCAPAPGHGATLVKVLALRGTLAAEQAMNTLWPDVDVATGRSRLRNLLNRVRSQSGEIIERRGESLSLSPDVSVDIDEFERMAVEAFTDVGQRRAGIARLALAAHSGELLPSDIYQDWAAAPRERLRRRLLSLVDIVVDDACDKGDLDDAVRWLDFAISIEPFEESRYARICEALLAQGRRATARSMGERAVAMLEELGVVPGVKLRAILVRVEHG